MSAESAFIAALRGLATHPAARNLLDDAAVMEIFGTNLVLSHDMIVEGVHFLPGDPPEDVAWKLLAVNLSDLAGKGARPIGILLGYGLSDAAWDARFIAGLGQALSGFTIPLLGGDTVAMPAGAPRTFGLTAIGEADHAPARSGARAGDDLWVSGTIGDAGAGLRIARGDVSGPETLAAHYRRPRPRLELGQALAPHVSAMMDVSDGMLIDASRMTHASEVALTIDLDQMPLSADYLIFAGEGRDARVTAAIAGDDYELLFAAPPEHRSKLHRLSDDLGVPLTRVGTFAQGAGLALRDQGEVVPLPPKLGFEHG